ncbi:MAG TPA: endonuclease domain-containing protein [Flavobacteriaceae bacterium]|nr:endonuclease domain-containing protein [Flavobacteriaceae bacterium]
MRILSPLPEGCPHSGRGVLFNFNILDMKKVVTHIYDKPIYWRKIRVLPANRFLKARARSLRKAGVLAEVVFWLQVHKGKFHQIDFDRQRIIGNYIVDFYVKSLGLVIEIDGSSHNHKEDYDARRQAYLERLGLVVYRISDLRVKGDLDNVLKELEEFIVQEFGS